MISLELSSIQAKSAEREVIASACERFIRDGGKIVAVPGIEGRYDSPHAWNRNDMALPGSSQTTRDHNADAALAERIKEIAAKGGGISSMRVTLQVDPSRIKRVAKAFGIEIPTARAPTTAGAPSNQRKPCHSTHAQGRDRRHPGRQRQHHRRHGGSRKREPSDHHALAQAVRH